MGTTDHLHGHARRTVVVAWICFAFLAVVPALIFDLIFVGGERSPIPWRQAVLVVLASAVAALAMNLLSIARAIVIAKGLSAQAVNNVFALALVSTVVTVLVVSGTSFLMMQALVGSG